MSRRKKEENIEIELREEDVIKLCDALDSIPDCRPEKNPRYTLSELITMLVYSTFCNNIGATGAAWYCKLHAFFSQEHLAWKPPPLLLCLVR